MKRAVLLLLVLVLAACVPAAAPSAAPVLIATEKATPPTTMTSVPTFTLTPAPTPPPDGPCDNPLVPLAIGNQWKYRVTTDSGEKIYNLNAVNRQDAANILMLVEFGDEEKSVQEQVICSNGAIEGFPLFVMDMLFADRLNKFINTYHDKGIYAPAYASFAERGWVLDWEAYYLTEEGAQIKNPMGPPDLFLLPSSPIDLVFQMDGSQEAVTVPAGEFPQALKVHHEFTVSATLGTGAGGHLIVATTQWYEPYVGLVRARLDKATLFTNGQDLSVPMTSILELIEFTPGN